MLCDLNESIPKSSTRLMKLSSHLTRSNAKATFLMSVYTAARSSTRITFVHSVCHVRYIATDVRNIEMKELLGCDDVGNGSFSIQRNGCNGHDFQNATATVANAGDLFYQILTSFFSGTADLPTGSVIFPGSYRDFVLPLPPGIDAIWLSPIYPSPMADFGYDVADYCESNRCSGDLEEFDRTPPRPVPTAAGARSLILTSSQIHFVGLQHPWFVGKPASRENPKPVIGIMAKTPRPVRDRTETIGQRLPAARLAVGGGMKRAQPITTFTPSFQHKP